MKNLNMTPASPRPQNAGFRRFFPLHLLFVFVVMGLGLAIADPAFTAADITSITLPTVAEHAVAQDQLDLSQTGRSRPAIKEYLYNLEKDRHSDLAGTDVGSGQNDNFRSSTEPANGVDPTFNARFEDGYTRVHAVAVQSDGKIIVGGIFPLVNGERRNGLVRLNADGTIDASFNPGNLGPGGIDAVELLPDGKIYVGGTFSSYNGVTRLRIARLNADGTLDTTFDPGGGTTNGSVLEIEPLPDGKVLAAGSFTQFNGTPISRIVRLNIDGTFDPSFTPPIITNLISSVKLQLDGQILIGGFFSTVAGLPRAGTARLNTNGTHDTTFNPINNTPAAAIHLDQQLDGKILVAGGYSGYLNRLNPDGSLDASFSAPAPPGSTVHDLILLPGGKILASGYFDDGADLGFGVVRLNADGSLDGTFTPQLSDTNFLEVFSIALTPDGKIVGGGDIYRIGNGLSKHVFRLNGDGSVDLGFTTNIEGFGEVRAMLRQPDGKLIVGGRFRKVNNSARDNIARLNADGTVDPSFVGAIDNSIFTLALQPDGKVLVGGQFFLTNGIETGPAVRLNANGTIDTGFILPGDVAAGFIYKVLVQPDGKVLASGLIGNPRAPNGTTGVYRVNSDGSEDVTFTLAGYTGLGFDGFLLADGRIVLGGNGDIAGSGLTRLARLNPNGTVDTSFNTGTGANSTVWAVAPTSDGKVLTGGFFTTINGQYARGLARLNTDGSLDQSFTSGLGINGSLYEVFVQPDDKIMIGGTFSLYNNIVRKNLARLNPDGTIDESFTDQANNVVYALDRQPDGKYLIAGSFTSVNGGESLGMARLSETDLTPPANDNFVSAEVISGNSGTASGTNSNATAEAGEPAHAGFPAATSVWYRWTAPDTGLFSFSTSGSSFDTRLGVYTGSSVSALTEVASNDDSTFFDTSSRVVFSASEGTEYFIAVDGKNGETGIVNLIWRQSARTYRIYAQTGNGNISPRIPTIIATRTSDNSQYPAQPISPGVFELDLPVDNATYIVSIGGPDIWVPNSFVLDNSTRPANNTDGSTVEDRSPTGSGFNFVTVARTVSATVSGVLQGVTSTNGVEVFLGSESGPNPIEPIPCEVSQSSQVLYSCQFIVDTLHQIKPSLNGMVFAPVNRQYPMPVTMNIIPGPGSQFVATGGPTYNITGLVTGNGEPLFGAVVSLTGSKMHSNFTSSDGTYQFNNLPAGGTYTVSVEVDNFTFEPQTVVDLQSNQVINMAAKSGCSFTLPVPSLSVPATGGQQSFAIDTESGCSWQTTNSASWITVNNSSGNGPSTVIFTAQPNIGLARTATIQIAGQSFTVEQANGCTFSAAPVGSTTFPAPGGMGSFEVTASDGACILTPTATDYCMIDPGGSTTGNTPVNFTVSENRGVARNAVINVGGQAFTLTQDAATGTHRARFDFDGDGRSDISVFRPSEGSWYLLNSAGFTALQFGTNGDIPVAADYDGDGKADIAVFRPFDGFWYRIESSTQEFIPFPFGQAGDIPVPADYDGDGRADIAVYRPSTGAWYLLQSTQGISAVQFGVAEDKPVAADYDGDGKADIAVFRPSSGVWYILNSASTFSAVQFGVAEDVPVPADYDRDGRADIAVYRPSNNFWYREDSSSGQFVALQFGLAGDKPVPGDYNGDKSADIAVFRPSHGHWYLWSCTNNQLISATHFGVSTDIPIAYPITP